MKFYALQSPIKMPLMLLLDLIASASGSMTNENRAGEKGQPLLIGNL
jgi:hypothetical protein